MHALDTNALVRLLVRDDEKQARAAAAFVAPGAWISNLVLLEATWVLDAVYHRTAKQIAACIGMLLDHESLVLENADVVAQALAAYRMSPSLGFTDCLVLEVAKRAGHLPLGTFDRGLAKLDGARRIGT
jgi:predicted nucleic-acid-binding protein